MHSIAVWTIGALATAFVDYCTLSFSFSCLSVFFLDVLLFVREFVKAGSVGAGWLSARTQ